MRILIACEFSGVVREAFRERGHEVLSCDLLPSEIPGRHHQGDVREVLFAGWDLMIAFPPCTHLAVSGAPHFARKQVEQAAALDFVRLLLNAPIDHIALENPVSIISSKIRKPDQIVQPYQFGHAERKTTCLWLKNLPHLHHTTDWQHEVKAAPMNKQNPLHYLPPSPERWKNRSRTYQGIAEAMADTWGVLSPPQDGAQT